jgi:hypothetical protein
LVRVNLELCRTLERAEAMANAAFVEARHELAPTIGAEWIEVAGAYAMFDGVGSPLTQTFGLGLFEPFVEPQFAEIEEFFRSRGASTDHEVSSFAAPETLSLLAGRGYSPIEASVVLTRSTFDAVASSQPSSVAVRIIDPSEFDVWAKTAAMGWGSESPDLAAFVEGLGVVMARARGVTCFLGEIDSAPVAAGTLNLQNGVALMAGASTVPDARRLGAQNALLRARLAYAAQHDVQTAMIVTQPGSASQRNAERNGFRAMHTRSKWSLMTSSS